MKNILGIAFVQLAALASVLGLYFTVLPPNGERPAWHWMIMGGALAGVLILSYWEISTFMNSRPKEFRTQEKINAYMCRWLSSGGRAVIFSRDMSWAHGEQVRRVLVDKAGRRELTVCLEHDIELTDELKRSGAQIITYQAIGHIPRSRFTIMDFEREGARVAVGLHQNGRHVIQEYRNGEGPFFAVAEDLAKMLIALQRSSK